MTTYKFQDYRLKPIQAIQYDGTLAMAAWFVEQSEEDGLYEFALYSDDEGHSLHFRGQEVKPYSYLRKGGGEFTIETGRDMSIYEPVPKPDPTKNTIYHVNYPIKGM